MRFFWVSLLTACWLAVLTIGFMVGSGPYRQALSEPGGFTVGMVLMFTITYTYSNVALLASLAGGIAALLRKIDQVGSPLNRLVRVKLLVSGGLRGAAIAVLMTATSLVIQPNLFSSVTQGQYTLLAPN